MNINKLKTDSILFTCMTELMAIFTSFFPLELNSGKGSTVLMIAHSLKFTNALGRCTHELVKLLLDELDCAAEKLSAGVPDNEGEFCDAKILELIRIHRDAFERMACCVNSKLSDLGYTNYVHLPISVVMKGFDSTLYASVPELYSKMYDMTNGSVFTNPNTIRNVIMQSRMSNELKTLIDILRGN